ncbi:MAG: GatB/YqeY domain-containing protein [bacterium]|nr:GatB/YqeY domain-containing protein [bacterium]
MLKDKIKEDLKNALKQRNTVDSGTFKMLWAAIINKEIELNKKTEGLSDEEILSVIRSEAKKRQDSIDAYLKGGRPELADNERKEQELLKTYLPADLSSAEIEKIIQEAVVESEKKDFGAIMKIVMAKIKGRADGQRVSAKVKETLGE